MSDCTSAQTFCKINGQLVKDNLNISFPNIGNKKTKLEPDWKQQIIDILQTIHDYGNAGTRNPTTEEINNLNTISEKQKILISDYNDIINILGGTKVNKKDRILGTYFSDLKTYIENYQLNSDRCNECNSGCNTTCQISAQCDDYCNSCNVSCDSGCESYVACGSGYVPDCGQNACSGSESCYASQWCGSCDSGL